MYKTIFKYKIDNYIKNTDSKNQKFQPSPPKKKTEKNIKINVVSLNYAVFSRLEKDAGSFRSTSYSILVGFQNLMDADIRYYQ